MLSLRCLGTHYAMKRVAEEAGMTPASFSRAKPILRVENRYG